MTTDHSAILGICGRIRSGKDTAADHFVDACGAVRTGYGDMLARALKAMRLEATRRNQQALSTLVRLPQGPCRIDLDLGGFRREFQGVSRPDFLARLAMFKGALAALHIDPTHEDLKRLEALVTLEEGPRASQLRLGGWGEDILAKGIFVETQELKGAGGRVVMAGVRRFADIDLFRAREPAFKLLYVQASLETRWKRAVNDPAKPDEAKMTLDEYRERDNAETEREIEDVGATADFVVPNEGTKEEFRSRLHEVADAMGWLART